MQLVTRSIISNEFNGLDDSMIFELDNGQIWIQDEYKYKYKYIYRPTVSIASDGNKCYMAIDGMDEVVSVRRLTDYVESYIVNDFNGWDGDTIFELKNGQKWKQSEYAYTYHYAYRPKAIIYNSGFGYKIKVDGLTETISVNRIR